MLARIRSLLTAKTSHVTKQDGQFAVIRNGKTIHVADSLPDAEHFIEEAAFEKWQDRQV